MEIAASGRTLQSVSMCAGEEDMSSPGMLLDEDQPWQGAAMDYGDDDDDDEPPVDLLAVQREVASSRARAALSTPLAPIRMASLPPSSVVHAQPASVCS